MFLVNSKSISAKPTSNFWRISKIYISKDYRIYVRGGQLRSARSASLSQYAE